MSRLSLVLFKTLELVLFLVSFLSFLGMIIAACNPPLYGLVPVCGLCAFGSFFFGMVFWRLVDDNHELDRQENARWKAAIGDGVEVAPGVFLVGRTTKTDKPHA